MTILVQSPGMFTTIQDLGRPGHGIQGVSRAGAADPLALRIGNRLLGNPDNTAALEMTLIGGTFTFPDGAEIALTGAQPSAHRAWQPITINPNETVKLGPFTTGARCYLCVLGGIAVTRAAGSASTHILSGLGPAPLRKGDLLPIGPATHKSTHKSVPTELTMYRHLLRVTVGPQSNLFHEPTFYRSEYTVALDSNRMGLRLDGPAIASTQKGEMVTEGVPLGAIQIPANGQPIILFVDQQTTGGYPKIANIITADLPSTGQLRPGDRISFQRVTNAEAQQILRQQEALLNAL